MEIKMNTDTRKKYDVLPCSIKEDLYEAMVWAKSLLTRHEGDGHLINVTSSPYTDNQVTCCFAKPESIAEHCGEYMDTASEAVVAAVLEYLNGE